MDDKNTELRSVSADLHSYFCWDEEAAAYVEEIIDLPCWVIASKVWRYYVDAGNEDPVNASAEVWEMVAERLIHDYAYKMTRAD